MSRRFPRMGLVALVLAGLVLPLAAADHAYSHRYILYGRVVDAEGNPVPGLTVNVATRSPFEAEGGCAQQPGTETEAFGRTETRPVTNAYGEFMYCWHTHTMSRISPGGATVSVAGTNYTQDITFDGYYRTTFLPIKLPTVMDQADRAVLGTTYTVLGRLWRPDSDVTVEGIKVQGDTIQRENVTVTLKLPDGSEVSEITRSNNYGDFSVRLNVTQRVTEGTVVVNTTDQRFESAVDPTLGVTAFKAEFPKQRDPFLRNLAIAAGVIVGLGVVVGAGWYGIRKVQQKREDDAVRRASVRKRAKR